jgi:hypothetical protein
MEINCNYEIVHILVDSFAAEIVCAYFYDFLLTVLFYILMWHCICYVMYIILCYLCICIYIL